MIPPHIVDAIEQNGDAEQKAQAKRAKLIGQTIRTSRALLGGLPLLSGGNHRAVFDAGRNEQPWDDRIRREEDQPVTGDADVDRAYDGLGNTIFTYQGAFGRNGIDGRGMGLNAYVHYGESLDNAYWDGSRMVFGDGDGRIFNSFTLPIDVVAHELTHGVTQFTANLVYQYQSGALNEHISDVFGIMVKQRTLGIASRDANWLIGEGLLAPGINGRGLREMLNPGTAYDDGLLGKDPQPAHMNNYIKTTQDNGGVHLNSGLMNRVFALACNAVAGNSWDTIGPVWYRVLSGGKLRSSATFREFVCLALDEAGDYRGAIEDSAKVVGIL